MVEHDFGDRTKFREWLVDGGFRNYFHDALGKEHVACPVVWFGKNVLANSTDTTGTPDPADIERYLGGHDAHWNGVEIS